MEKERYWSIIVYPESAPKDWIQILNETGLQIGISPLHDKDKNIGEIEEIKKAHYHILLCFNGPTTYNRVNKICEKLNSPIPKRVLSPIGLIRYFTHKDNPEKYQYNEDDIKGLNGFDYKEFIGLSVTQQNQMKIAVCKLIKNIGIKEYKELIDYLIENQLNDMFSIVSDKTIFFNTYLTSKRHSEDI